MNVSPIQMTTMNKQQGQQSKMDSKPTFGMFKCDVSADKFEQMAKKVAPSLGCFPDGPTVKKVITDFSANIEKYKNMYGSNDNISINIREMGDSILTTIKPGEAIMKKLAYNGAGSCKSFKHHVLASGDLFNYHMKMNIPQVEKTIAMVESNSIK